VRAISIFIAVTVAVTGLLMAGLAQADSKRGNDSRDADITVGPLVQVTRGWPFGPLRRCGNFPGIGGGTNYVGSEVEPFVAINPTDPDNIVALWQQDRWSNGGARSNVAGVTLDGGRTWRSVVVPGLSRCSGGRFERASDPWISFSPDGTLHQVSLVVNLDPPPDAGIGFGPNGMAVSRSLDGGLTWSRPIRVITDTDPQVLNDKQSITADPTDSDFVYTIWDRIELDGADGSLIRGPARLARTTDGGLSWEPSREIFDPGLDNQILGAQILVQKDGTLLAFFNKIISINPDDTVNNFPDRLTVIRSRDKGLTWDGDGPGGGTEIAQILANGTVTPDTGAAIRDAAILFDVAIDPRKDRLYAVWQDYRFTGFDQIAFSQSKDGGRSWSNPIRINKTPANPRRPFTQQALLPSVTVAKNGTVVVTYYDFRNDEAGPRELADHFAIFCKSRCETTDGWGREIRLTDESFDYALAPVARGLFIGDYLGLAAHGNRIVSFFPQTVSERDTSSMFIRTLHLGDDDHDDDDDDRKKRRRKGKDRDDDDGDDDDRKRGRDRR
jgi:hypothetical protein